MKVAVFARILSQSLVAEIRRRASDPSTQTAALSLAQYLSESSQVGALCVQALNVLVAKGAHYIGPLVEASLPSTMVKVAFLLFDLPRPATAVVRRRTNFYCVVSIVLLLTRFAY